MHKRSSRRAQGESTDRLRQVKLLSKIIYRVATVTCGYICGLPRTSEVRCHASNPRLAVNVGNVWRYRSINLIFSKVVNTKNQTSCQDDMKTAVKEGLTECSAESYSRPQATSLLFWRKRCYRSRLDGPSDRLFFFEISARREEEKVEHSQFLLFCFELIVQEQV
eukprot:g32940.t1